MEYYMLKKLFKKKEQELPPELIGLAQRIAFEKERLKTRRPIYKPSIKLNAY